MFSSIRSKLIASFLGVSFLVGAVSLLVGGHLLYKAVLSEATNRVRLDLNTAREIYLNRIRSVNVVLNTTMLGSGFRSEIKNQDAPALVIRLRQLAKYAELDFVGVVTREGATLCRIGPHSITKGKKQIPNPIANLAIERRTPVSGTVVLSKEFLSAEDPRLANQAMIRLLPTPRAAPRAEEEETAGIALAAAMPVLEDNKLLGVLYGGVLLNRNFTIVDQVRDTVSQQEMYKGRNIGTATIFFKDIRVSTNVLTPGKERAIGTQVSEEVREQVLQRGKKWTGRAFVVNDWYITAYEPIVDIFGERVGMLYVGVLEAKYADIRNKALAVFILLTIAGLALAIGLGYFLESIILRPVHRLIAASNEVSHGDFSPNLGPIATSEIGVLQRTFADMLTSLQERARRIEAESELQLVQSEKQASIGRLAAGVAHEINNPLTGVLTFTHMLLQRKEIQEDIRSDLETIAQQTERVRNIVKNLLDFSRQTALNPEPTDINRLVKSVVSMMKHQALIKGVNLQCRVEERIPLLTLDANQIQSVLFNLLLNALDATTKDDFIVVTIGIGISATDEDRKGVELTVWDTGCGIPPEHLDKLFDPFFTTKGVGQGTGLGLAVSHGIVQGHGGTIRVQSEVGKGSTFTVWLPIEGESGERKATDRR